MKKCEDCEYKRRALSAETKLKERYALREELCHELGLDNPWGDEALHKALERIRELKEAANIITHRQGSAGGKVIVESGTLGAVVERARLDGWCFFWNLNTGGISAERNSGVNVSIIAEIYGSNIIDKDALGLAITRALNEKVEAPKRKEVASDALLASIKTSFEIATSALVQAKTNLGIIGFDITKNEVAAVVEDLRKATKQL